MHNSQGISVSFFGFFCLFVFLCLLLLFSYFFRGKFPEESFWCLATNEALFSYRKKSLKEEKLSYIRRITQSNNMLNTCVLINW